MNDALEGSGRDLMLRYYPGIFLQGVRKTTKPLSQDSWSLGRYLNPGPPGYRGMLTTRPRRVPSIKCLDFARKGIIPFKVAIRRNLVDTVNTTTIIINHR
jgi:hypothetical protein